MSIWQKFSSTPRKSTEIHCSIFIHKHHWNGNENLPKMVMLPMSIFVVNGNTLPKKFFKITVKLLVIFFRINEIKAAYWIHLGVMIFKKCNVWYSWKKFYIDTTTRKNLWILLWKLAFLENCFKKITWYLWFCGRSKNEKYSRRELS